MAEPGSAGSAPQAWVEFIRRIARFGSLFGIGLGLTAVFGFAAIAVLTRALAPAEYGQLAVLLVFSGFLTILIGLGTLSGIMSWVFGGTGEDEGDLDDSARSGAADPPRAICTGIVLTVAVAALAMVLTWVFRGPLGDLLAKGGAPVSLVLLAALSSVPASLIRLLANVLRYGRRPERYVVAEVARPFFVFAGACVLLSTGGGVRAALLLYVLAGFAAVAVCLVLIRQDVRLGFSATDARMILRRGRVIAPSALANWTILNADTFFLSLYATSAQVGTYRLATGLARIGSYAVSLFMRSWGPLTAAPIAAAVTQQHGRAETSARTLEYFVVASVWLLLVLAAFADVLVRIAPRSYSDAAPLIPLLAAVFVLRGTFVMSYHGSERSDRRRWLFSMFGVAVVLFVGSCVTLIPAIGEEGAALAGVIAFGVVTLVMLVLAQRGPVPMPLNWPRLLGSAAIGVVLYGVITLVGADHGITDYLVDTAVVLVYPALLLSFRLVPRAIVRPFFSVARALVPLRASSKPLRRRLEALDADELELLDRLVRRREPVIAVAADAGWDVGDVRDRLASILRRLAALPETVAVDGELVRYVLEDESVVHHTTLGRHLTDEGHDPLALDAVYETAKAVRGIRDRDWPQPAAATATGAVMP
jgi:O-antigen/teichoic acid export membrane protein